MCPRLFAHSVCVVLLTHALGVLTCGDSYGQQTIEWGLRAGDRFRIITSQDVTMTADVDGKSGHISHRTVVQISWHVKAVDPDKTARISQSIERLKVQLKSPGVDELVYDTADAKPPTGPAKRLAAAVQPLVESGAELNIDARSRVSEVRLTGDGEALRRIKTPAAEAFSKFFTEEGILELSGLKYIALPEGPVGVGERWDRAWDIRTTAGLFRREATYELTGEEIRDGRKLARVVLTWKLTPVDDTEPRLPGEPERKPVNRIEEQENEGAILFDRSAGYPVEVVVRQETTLVSRSTAKEIRQKVVSDMKMKMSKLPDG